MSHTLATRLSLGLLVALCLFSALPVMAADAPASAPCTASSAAEPAPVRLDSFMIPKPVSSSTAIDCHQLDNAYCTYEWHEVPQCCVASSPGTAFCPPVCL